VSFAIAASIEISPPYAAVCNKSYWKYPESNDIISDANKIQMRVIAFFALCPFGLKFSILFPIMNNLPANRPKPY